MMGIAEKSPRAEGHLAIQRERYEVVIRAIDRQVLQDGTRHEDF